MLLLGCFRRLAGAVVLLLLVAVAAWWFRGDLAEAWRAVRGEDPPAVPSEEVAAAASVKLEELAAGRSRRAALSAVELQSLLEYRYRDLFPSFVHDPRVSIEDDRLRLEARVPTDALGGLPGADQARALLPDTADVTVMTNVLPLEPGRVALAVDEVTAARIPVPDRIVPSLLARVGRVEEPGLPEDALALRLPPGAATAYVRADSLVLLADSTTGGG